LIKPLPEGLGQLLTNSIFPTLDRIGFDKPISKMLFYGYAALFWKSLRYPPENLHNSATFDHFFHLDQQVCAQNRFAGKTRKINL
jgi:hypothetical protein